MMGSSHWVNLPKYENNVYVIGFVAEKSSTPFNNKGGFRITTMYDLRSAVAGENYELSAEEVIDYLTSIYEGIEGGRLMLEPV
jgi:hypothetical protein